MHLTEASALEVAFTRVTGCCSSAIEEPLEQLDGVAAHVSAREVLVDVDTAFSPSCSTPRARARLVRHVAFKRFEPPLDSAGHELQRMVCVEQRLLGSTGALL